MFQQTEKKRWEDLLISLVVEQTPMRRSKPRAGLSQGRMIDDFQRNIFIFSRTICINVEKAVHKLIGPTYFLKIETNVKLVT